MRILLDTHVFIWWLSDPSRLSSTAHDCLTDPGNEVIWSVASSWEVAIKTGLGKLRLPGPPHAFLGKALVEQGITIMPVQHAHACRTADLPSHHRDPFDRLLVAQAQLERTSILSSDRILARYDVAIIW